VRAIVVVFTATICCAQSAYSGAAASSFGFIEFRARGGGALGHTLIAYGEVAKTGKRLRYRASLGLYPGTALVATPLSAVLFLPGYVGTETEDEKSPVRFVYRRQLTRRSYTELLATVRQLRGAVQGWHFLFFNCNEFAAIVARSVGLRTPPTFELPEHFVRDLAILNGRSS